MVCLGNICINTLHKGDDDEEDIIIIIIIIIIIMIISLLEFLGSSFREKFLSLLERITIYVGCIVMLSCHLCTHPQNNLFIYGFVTTCLYRSAC
jgi:hypothetical protein